MAPVDSLPQLIPLAEINTDPPALQSSLPPALEQQRESSPPSLLAEQDRCQEEETRGVHKLFQTQPSSVFVNRVLTYLLQVCSKPGPKPNPACEDYQETLTGGALGSCAEGGLLCKRLPATFSSELSCASLHTR